VIYEHDLWPKIGYDYALRHLERRQFFAVAGEFCAMIKDRHPMAVTYAVMDSIQAVLRLLQTSLSGAQDLRECWIRALELSRPTGDQHDWRGLLEKSTISRVVSLDDIFGLMPNDMPIEPFQLTIRRSLLESREKADKNAGEIRSLTERSGEQRAIIQKGPSIVLELDPLAACWLCKLPIYSDKFLAFPCEHAVHIKCLLANMHMYFSPSEQLNLISSAARCAKDETKMSGLADIITRSCPICGERSLNVLNKDFVRKYDDRSRELWALPNRNVQPPELPPKD
jgi:hypothetical protein